MIRFVILTENNERTEMKTLKAVVDELREQVEEATDPTDPKKLTGYTGAILGGLESLISVLSDDPTMAALALHGQIKFEDNRPLIALTDRIKISKNDWPPVKAAVKMRPKAHQAVKLLEEANLQQVLVIAVVANFKLNQRRAESAIQEEETI